MFRIIKRVVKAPLSYIADLRKITLKKYLLLNTNFSPSYPIMIFASLASTLALAAFIIYNIFNLATPQTCLENVRIGAYIMSILYPLETVLFFICLTGSIALSKSNCWKTIMILLFGPLLCGFGFGELAFIEMCLVASDNPHTFQTLSIFKQPEFISAMIYLYLSFIVLYFILVPSIEFLYSRQKQDEQPKAPERRLTQSKRTSKVEEQPKEEQAEALQESSTCCSKFVCFIYYFLHILFAIAVCFILLMKLLGPVLFTYFWIQMASDSENYQQTQEKRLFALTLLSYFGPLGLTIVVLGIQRIVRLARKQPDQNDNETQSKEKDTIDLTEQSYRSSKGSDLEEKGDPKRKESSEYREGGLQLEEEGGQRRISLGDVRNSGRQTLL